jgi:hypothetical protein
MGESLHELHDAIQQLKKRSEEAEWYLGEERAAKHHLEHLLQEKNQYIQRLEEENQNLRRQWEESQWYLNEEKAKVAVRR